MLKIYQQTIKKSVNFEGVGLHTGKKSNIKILPGKVDEGIIFKRIDLPEHNIVQASYKNVTSAKLCTTLENENGVKVSTVEHLLAALYIAEIDNAIIEIDNEEVPIMDGSAKVFVDSIKEVGLKFSDQPIKIIKINKNISLEESDKHISLDKSNVAGDIEFEIRYKNKIINIQKNKINVFEDDLTNIFNSRTFCLYEDIEKLKKLDLGKGGSLDNAIVVKNDEILNKNGLRNTLEFVNHKILDCMGDLFLSGYKIIGSLKCSQGGHKLTNELLKKVFEDRSNYSLIEIKGKELPHNFANFYNLRSIA